MLCPFCQLANSNGDTCRFCGAPLNSALPPQPPRDLTAAATFTAAPAAAATLAAATSNPLSSSPLPLPTRSERRSAPPVSLLINPPLPHNPPLPPSSQGKTCVWRFARCDAEPPLLGIAFWRQDETGLCLATSGADGGAYLFRAAGETNSAGAAGAAAAGGAAAAAGDRSESNVAPGALSPGVLLSASNKTRGARCVAFAPTSGYVACGYDTGVVRLRGTVPNATGRRNPATGGRTGRSGRAPESGAAPVNALTFSPDETLLAIGFGDGTVTLWRIADGKSQTIIVEKHCGVTALAFSPNGATLAVGADNGAVGVWEIASGINEWTQTRHEFWIRALAFSPNSCALASGGYGGAVRVWAAQSGVELQTLLGHDVSVSALAFAPDNRMLLSGGLDEAVRVWDSWTGAAQHSAVAHEAVIAIALRSGCAPGANSPDALAIATMRDIIVWQGSVLSDWGALKFPDNFAVPS